MEMTAVFFIVIKKHSHFFHLSQGALSSFPVIVVVVVVSIVCFISVVCSSC